VPLDGGACSARSPDNEQAANDRGHPATLERDQPRNDARLAIDDRRQRVEPTTVDA